MSSSSIFIGKLSSRMRTYELEDEFKRFGKIRDIEFKKVKIIKLNKLK